MVSYQNRAIKRMRTVTWQKSLSFFAAMGGVELEFKDCTHTLGTLANSKMDGELAPRDLRRALQLNLLDLDNLCAEDVRSRSKTSYIVKSFVCLQASWLVAQVVGRIIDKLPITTLEVVTVGYVVCALITHFCWWHKPQDAEVPIKVCCRSVTKRDFYQQISDVHIERSDEYGWQDHLVTTIGEVRPNPDSSNRPKIVV
jgi:hypothetical protein